MRREDTVVDTHAHGLADGGRKAVAAEHLLVDVAVVENHRTLVGTYQLLHVEDLGRIDEDIVLMGENLVIVGLDPHQVILRCGPEDVLSVALGIGVKQVGDQRRERLAVRGFDQPLLDRPRGLPGILFRKFRVHDQPHVGGRTVGGIAHQNALSVLGCHEEIPFVLALQTVFGIGHRQNKQVSGRRNRQVDHFVELLRRGQHDRHHIIRRGAHRPFKLESFGVLHPRLPETQPLHIELAAVYHAQTRCNGLRHLDLDERNILGLQLALVFVTGDGRQADPGHHQQICDESFHNRALLGIISL